MSIFIDVQYPIRYLFSRDWGDGHTIAALWEAIWSVGDCFSGEGGWGTEYI